MKKYINEFLDVKSVEGGLSNNTLQAYRRDVKQFAEFVENKSVELIQEDDVVSFLKYLNSQGMDAKTTSRKLSCLREFFKYLLSERYIENNPIIKIKNPKIGKSLPNYLTHEDIERICKQAELEDSFSMRRMDIMILLMYTSGLRVSELV